jgi:hypothetical protein
MRNRLGVLLALLGLVGCRPKEPPGPALVLPSPDPDGAYRFTANALFDLYATDGQQADRLLRGKTVVVTGWVVRDYTRVEPDPERLKRGERTLPDLYLHVDHPSNGFFLSSDGIICNFPETARATLRTRLKRLGLRDEVRVRGTAAGKLGSVFLENCALL